MCLSVTSQHSYLNMPVSAHSNYCFHPCLDLVHTQVSPAGLRFLQKLQTLHLPQAPAKSGSVLLLLPQPPEMGTLQT